MYARNIEINQDIEGGSIEPKKTEINNNFKNEHRESHGQFVRWHDFFHLPRTFSLNADKNVCLANIYQLRFAVLCAAINLKMLNPSYPIMVGKDHPDAFPTTDPFDFNSATYFIPMCSLLGVAVSSIFVGKISDRVGRKYVLLFLSTLSGIGSIAKYFARKTFWGFCITNFVFGFFHGHLPVTMAYIGDVFSSKKEKQKELGTLVGCHVIGNSGGGIIAILMNKSGLFATLWVGAALMFLSTITTSLFMLDPGDERMQYIREKTICDEKEVVRPKKVNHRILWNIVIGSLVDNFGSTALFPLCLSPLALEHYTLDFIHAGKEPILSIVGFQWLSVCIAFMVVPSTMITPKVFAKVGIAASCVLGNIFTAVVTLILLLIGNISATNGSFAGFVTVLYLGLPFTVFSQLSTAPMLDLIAPEDKIGYVQGLKASAMNFGMAIAPWIFGLLADHTGTNTAIWIGIGISLVAALVNVPLMWHRGYGPIKRKLSLTNQALPGEDEELITKILNGEYIPPEEFASINRQRWMHGKPVLVPKVKTYEEEKDTIDDLRSHAIDSFRFQTANCDRILADINNPEPEWELPEICKLYNAAVWDEEQNLNDITCGLGQWFIDYLMDNGYHPHISSLLIKQMIISAFPSFTQEKEYTPDNLPPTITKRRQVMHRYQEVNEKDIFFEDVR